MDKKNIQDKIKEFLANKKLVWRIVIIFAVIMALSHLRGCIASRRGQAIPPRPVQTRVATSKDVPIYMDSFGDLAALYNVDIKSQVTGEIKEVHFSEGDTVKKGDLLFIIDPEQYKAAEAKAQAALAGDLADLGLKKDILERNKPLFEKQLVSEQQFNTYQTDVAAAQAQVEADKANLKTAQLNLEYCYIKSPIDGITGKRQVDAGNIVTANSGPALVNIKTIDPLYVDFTIPERKLPELRDSMTDEKLKVEIRVDGDKNGPYVGELSFLDNTVDDTTGTVSLRATVPNENHDLWPGQFVQVRLVLRTEQGAVVVPYEAVQLGQQGEYLYVVTPKKTADLRIVETGMRDGDNIAIEKGVKKGETVVTVGQMGLSPGVPTVDVTQQKEQEKKGKRKSR